MNVAEWIAIAGLAMTVTGVIAAIVGRLIKHERRMGTMLTREEHERICAERNARVEKSIDDLREDTQRRHDENRDTLDEIKTTVNETHRRIDAVLLRRQNG